MQVDDLLYSKNIEFKQMGKDYVVKCLNPEHDDSNPSMRIDRVTGIFNCFSCGFKGNVFYLYGEKASKLHIQRELLKAKIVEKRAECTGLQMPPAFAPYQGEWRGISPETYKKFDAFTHHDSPHTGRLVFPLRDLSGKIVAFNGRHMSGGIPKYMLSPPGAKIPLFPMDVEPIQNSCILVEGIYDMINLHDKGLTNAICCFGTKNVTRDKLSILKLRGIERAFIFFDGDEPGQNAAEQVVGMAEEAGMIAKNFFVKNKDPGELSQSEVSWIKNKLYS